MKRPAFRWASPRNQAFAILGLFLLHLVWVLLGRGPSRRLEGLLDAGLRPVLSLSGRWESWRVGRQARAHDLEEARNEIRDLQSQLQALHQMRQAEGPRLAEAEEAIRLLGLSRLLPLPMSSARVVANLRQGPFRGYILDRGQQAGLVPDQGVIVPEGVVGRIWAVSATQASVLPLDAPNASTSVMVGASRATGILQGSGVRSAAIRYIGRQEVVRIGEPVFTSGLDQVFPRGLLVGWVTATRPLEVELEIQVALAAPLDKIGLALILPPAPRLELAPPPTAGGKGTPP